MNRLEKLIIETGPQSISDEVGRMRATKTPFYVRENGVMTRITGDRKITTSRRHPSRHQPDNGPGL